MSNNKGFTLIELLAVITIMGILMMVAIPMISRTIENSRKDTFIDTVKKYCSSVRTMWAADNFQCGNYVSSAVKTGSYYVKVDTSSDSHPVLLEQGGKSPWGNRDIKGYIYIAVYSINDERKVEVYPVLLDGIHGVNAKSDGSPTTVKRYEDLVRGDLVMSDLSYSIVIDESGEFRSRYVTFDLNGDGDTDDTIDGAKERTSSSVLCVER